MRTTLVAAALAAASLSFVLSPALANPVSELGIDITAAGNSHAEVQKFLEKLQPDTRRSVIDGCRYYLKEPATVQEQTIAFCKLAL